MNRARVVLPCYNEADRLDVEAIDLFVGSQTAIDLILVDDGSTDATGDLLAELSAAHPDRVRVIRMEENRGKAEAVRAGLRSALDEGSPYIGYWDADLATPLAQIHELMALFPARPAIDVVMGSRVRMLGRRIDRSGFRHYVGRFYATLASVALGLPVYDTQCGAKLFRSSPALLSALEQPFCSGWSFDVELLRRLQSAWGDSGIDRIVEVPLERWTNVGDSKVSPIAGTRAFASLVRMIASGRIR